LITLKRITVVTGAGSHVSEMSPANNTDCGWSAGCQQEANDDTVPRLRVSADKARKSFRTKPCQRSPARCH